MHLDLFCSIFFLLEGCSRSACKRRTRRLYRKNQWFEAFLSSAFAPPSAEANRTYTGAVRKRMKKQHPKKRMLGDFSAFVFRSRRRNRQKAPQMTSQTPSGTLPGTLQEAEIDPLFAPRAFQGRQDEFFGTPRAVPEPLRDGSGERLAAGSGPRAAQRPPGGHVGAILEPCWGHVGTIVASIFDPTGLHFGTSV